MSEQAQALESATPKDVATDGIGHDKGSPESERTFKADRENRNVPREKRRRDRDETGKYSANTAEKEPKVGGDAAPAEGDEAPKPWEGPGYTKRWKEPSRKAAEFLATHPEYKQHWDALQGELDPVYSYIGQRDQVLSQYRQRYDPLNDMLAPYEQQWKLGGMSVQQGVSQLLAYQDALARDPDATLPQLAAMFKPKDASRVLQALSQAWGADLGQVAQGAPYIDPAVQQMVSPLVQELHALKAHNWNQQQQQQVAQQNWILQQVDAFEQAKDDKGQVKHPFFREMFADMVALAQAQRAMGQNPNVEDIYTKVAAYHPAAAEWRAKQGAAVALAAASRQNEASKQAQEASRNISGSKATGRSEPPKTLREAMRMADKQLGYAGG